MIVIFDLISHLNIKLVLAVRRNIAHQMFLWIYSFHNVFIPVYLCLPYFPNIPRICLYGSFHLKSSNGNRRPSQKNLENFTGVPWSNLVMNPKYFKTVSRSNKNILKFHCISCTPRILYVQIWNFVTMVNIYSRL